MVKIGIPRALWYYDQICPWDNFFSELGIEAVVSKETDKQIFLDSLKFAPEEFCLPAKIAIGHVVFLKDNVDYIFLPHIVSCVKGSYCCPKFIGLPDIIRNTISDIPPIIEPVIDLNKQGLNKVLFNVGINLTKNPIKIYNAVKKAREFVRCHSEAPRFLAPKNLTIDSSAAFGSPTMAN